MLRSRNHFVLLAAYPVGRPLEIFVLYLSISFLLMLMDFVTNRNCVFTKLCPQMSLELAQWDMHDGPLVTDHGNMRHFTAYWQRRRPWYYEALCCPYTVWLFVVDSILDFPQLHVCCFYVTSFNFPGFCAVYALSVFAFIFLQEWLWKSVTFHRRPSPSVYV